MTVRRWFTLHYLLMLLCLLTMPLLVHKGIGIFQKLAAIQTAERLYHGKQLIEAEDWYRKARINRSIRYKEELISSRLEELAPISSMKEDLANISEQASRADSKRDFELLMDAYTKLQQAQSRYLTPEEPYSDYYRQLSEHYRFPQNFTGYFRSFKTMFLEQMDQNLTASSYEDESFRRNLLRIPGGLFGTEQEWLDELITAFRRYDETKLTRMAAEGLVEPMLSDATAMLAEYKSNNLEAPWIISEADSLIEALLKNDWDNDDYAAFAMHARQFTTFASSAYPESKVLSLAKSRMEELMLRAGKNAANGDYQEAIDLYTAIGHYQDTQAEIRAAELAWTLAEPARMLPSPAGGSGYAHIVSGRDRFGAKLYVAATDQNNKLYFGRMNAEESVQILSNQDLAPQEQIRTIAVDRDLSTDTIPVIVIEAASEARNARYAAFEVRESSIALLYSIEGDSLTVQPDGTLLVVNPVGEGEGQTAIFARSGGIYQFAGVKQDILDISADSVSQYPNSLVRFTCTVIRSGAGEALCMGSNSLILLSGDIPPSAEAVNVTVTGRFKQYAEQTVDEQLIGQIAAVLNGATGGPTGGQDKGQIEEQVEDQVNRESEGSGNGQIESQAEEQHDGPVDGQADGQIARQAAEQVDGKGAGRIEGQAAGTGEGASNGLLQSLAGANQISVPVVEVETIR
ncbi:hypothetical protein [Paenibacillus macerans]|uniref:Uncharacterized protein n=2 Tax=Paenibacillus macerans TaxID=44252 RepID=A0A090ZLR5_PAEMA|nr:hypothetical protein [Paenibacillus macerans]KFN11552.1 hypothetical protein DJ90_3748 [Paenibacillus macerans]MEC0149412.1 hypothetical protein [Paenibacillus macerans]SUA86132.1 Predicted membrane protein [Paenibacillus macerans]